MHGNVATKEQNASSNYIRYDIFPDGLFHHVKTLERMAIGDFASILENEIVDAITISG